MHQFWLLQPGRPGSSIYISQEHYPSYTPGTGFTFCHVMICLAIMEVYNSPPRRSSELLSSQSYDWRSVGQSVLVSGHHLGSMAIFFFTSTEINFSHLQFFSMGQALWWEDGSVIYSYKCCLTLQVLSLSGPSPAELQTVCYCLLSRFRPYSLFITAYDSRATI
jgi:hypothetical protein